MYHRSGRVPLSDFTDQLNFTIKKSRKSLWINLGEAGEAKVRVRALTDMDLALMSQAGFPVVK